MAIQFDTLRYVERLRLAGVSEDQAKAGAEALAAALGESASAYLASRDDVTGIKIELADIRSELKVMRWMLVTIVAGILSLLVKVLV
jgi:hypothetical protein